MPSIDELVEAWCARDRRVAFLPGDHAVIEATRGPRALIVDGVNDLANPSPDERVQKDLFHAWRGPRSDLRRARWLAHARREHHRRRARGAPRVRRRHGALGARGRGRRVRGGSRRGRARQAAAQWDFPACTVPLDGVSIAIAAGHPDDDEDALAACGCTCRQRGRSRGYRRAVLAGNARACAALEDALSLAGVTVRTTSPPAPLRPAQS